jgi:hypothetical protein
VAWRAEKRSGVAAGVASARLLAVPHNHRAAFFLNDRSKSQNRSEKSTYDVSLELSAVSFNIFLSPITQLNFFSSSSLV